MAYKPRVLAVIEGGTGLASTTANQILYSSATNTVAGLATANSGILATNGSGVPSITTASGNWLNTSRCAFGAYVNGDVANATGDGTVYTVIANTELFDQNSNYNNATGIFTAPVTGVYLFTVSALLTNIGSQNVSTFTIVTTSRSFEVDRFNASTAKEGNNAFNTSGSIITLMSANDTMRFNIQISDSTKTVTVSTSYITGFLLC